MDRGAPVLGFEAETVKVRGFWGVQSGTNLVLGRFWEVGKKASNLASANLAKEVSLPRQTNLAIQNEKTNLEKGAIWKYEATTSQIY